MYASVSTSVARARGIEPRVSIESVRMSRYRMYFDAAKAVRELGLRQTPVENALDRAVAWFRAKGYAPAR
jgi:dihydroflavonol-4-reductase